MGFLGTPEKYIFIPLAPKCDFGLINLLRCRELRYTCILVPVSVFLSQVSL